MKEEHESLVQKKQPMQLKGIGSSLTVLLDPTQPVEELKQELQRLFDPLKHQSANAHIVLDTGESDGHDELVRELGEFLKTNYRIGTITRPDREREHASAREKLRQREMAGGLFQRSSDVLMMAGLVRSGQKITAKKHFLLLGDLNPGSEIIAGGDILILGSLRGKASAGHPDNEEALILAMDFQPTQIQIGGIVAAGLPPSKGRGTEFAHVQNGVIVVEDYLKTNPFGGLPWPAIR